MAKQTINIGASPNDGTGTPLRTSFDYTNQNFTELYTATGPSGNNIVVPGNATISGDLTVDTSTLKVDSANNRVGIGTASPSNACQIQGTGQATVTPTVIGDQSALSLIDSAGLGNNGGMLVLGASVASGMIGQVAIKSLLSDGTQNGTANLAVFTRGATSDSTLTERYRIAANGIATWSNVGGVAGTAMTLNATSNLVLRGGTSGANGVGLTFPATQVASSDANCLDDYKEAAFTPTIEGGTIAGIGTYSSQVGRYTKVGNLVTVQILIAWTAHTGSGNLSIANLPYTSSSVSGLVASATIGYVDGLALTAGNTPLAYIQNNSSKISLLQTPTGGGSVSLVPMDTAATIAINVTYMV